MMGDAPIVYCWVAVWYPVWEMVMVCGVVGEVVSLRKKVWVLVLLKVMVVGREVYVPV